MHARNYRHVKNRAYTRKEYARGFPPPKIVKFTMGDTRTQFEVEGQLIATARVQIRHSALEAARVATNRVLMDKLINDYYMTVHPYPHIILRENKMIFGAHADRLQQGMRRSFGTAIGTAAKVEVGQPIITVRVKAAAAETAKESLKRGSAKLPIHCNIVIKKIESSPSKTEEAQPETETT
ncbi:MAG: 50S ribosomal protein L16 [Candidatus Bathyarchaeia archaeon]|jgi:large subunit ribosomal protein L10e